MSPATKSRSRAKATPAAQAPAATAAPVAAATPKPSILGRFFNKPAPNAPTTPAPAAVTTPMAKPEVAAPTNATPVPGGGHGLVWVNTESKVFHREGSRYYGKTKQGKYMTEEEAVKEGYRPPAKGQ